MSCYCFSPKFKFGKGGSFDMAIVYFPLSQIVVTIHVRRRYLYYLVNIMLPCMMMSLLVLVVFHLPPDSGEKVSLGVTVLLAFSVFQLMIAESVPTSSKSIPLIGKSFLDFDDVRNKLVSAHCTVTWNVLTVTDEYISNLAS